MSSWDKSKGLWGFFFRAKCKRYHKISNQQENLTKFWGIHTWLSSIKISFASIVPFLALTWCHTQKKTKWFTINCWLQMTGKWGLIVSMRFLVSYGTYRYVNLVFTLQCRVTLWCAMAEFFFWDHFLKELRHQAQLGNQAFWWFVNNSILTSPD